eukprot:TRINITY_DN3078_c0_g1_i1.p1 TRINITY_DN3078_c0_g1~~TRINITY_DN3078_c0_g1_i1.p1  ORF type:complete len:586 (+),score=131.58 TRINITY_DN3078_c0_g1_i1:50-1759(+)
MGPFLLILAISTVLASGSHAGLYQMPIMKKRLHKELFPEQIAERDVTSILYGAVNVTMEYYAAISLGTPEQIFLVQIDTGSASLAVPAVGCEQYTKTGNQPTGTSCDHADNFYDKSKSKTSKQFSCGDLDQCRCDQSTSLCTQTLGYGDGSFLQGPLTEDVFTLGGLSAKVMFGQIKMESEGFGGTTTDGILGMAYHALDPIDGDDVFAKLVEANKINNAFSMCLGPDGGMLTLGGADDNYSAGEMVYTPITSETYYVVEMNDVLVGGQSIGLPPSYYNDDQTIVDSGTTLLLLGETAFNAMVSTFQTTVCQEHALDGVCNPDSDGNTIFTPGMCSGITPDIIALFPNISFNLAGAGNLSVPPEMYFFGYKGYYCFGISPVDGVGAILGDVFMQNFNVLFDRENKRVGFAPVQNCRGWADGTFNIEKVSGDTQKTGVFTTTKHPLTIKVTYPNGQPAIGFEVKFSADSGLSFPDGGAAVTDSEGIAEVSAKVTAMGNHTVTVSLYEFNYKAVAFTVSGDSSTYIKIAVGVGAFVILVIAAIVAVVVIRRRRRNREHHYHKLESTTPTPE